MATFNHMVALFQNYPRTKHLYEDFYPAFARNRLFQTWWGGMKSVPTSYKQT